MPFCTQCGHQNPEGARFCARCGSALTQVVEKDASPGPQDTTTVIPVVTEDTSFEPTEEIRNAVSSLPADSALLVITRGQHQGSRFLLTKDETTIGRHGESEIFLDDVSVSRTHGLITRAEGVWTYTDAGSLNGTYVRKAMIDSPTELTNGDEVQVGKFHFAFFVGRA